jgi:MoaA/NifB/PqqE/SkfB family radical SAM enzyme
MGVSLPAGKAALTTPGRSGSARKVGHVLPVIQLGWRRVTGRKSPFQMTLSLTNRCNFRCEYCHIPLQHREEMNTAEWCDAIDQFVAGGMGRASIIGGEPLLRKDVGQIISHLKARGVHAAMNTNGWFVPQRIDEVAQLDLVCITLDGTAAVHDKQRHEGSYERSIKAIEALTERGVPTITMTVVTPSSAETIDHVLEVARRHRIRSFFQLEHDADVDVDLPIAARLSDDRVQRLAAHLLARKQEGWPVGNSRALLEAQRRQRYIGSCEDCHAGSYYGYVFSDGTVAPCLLTQNQVERGNGRTHGFVEAFQNLKAPQGPGCSCVPTHEVNRILDFDLRVLFGALEMALQSKRAAAALQA